MNTETPSPDLHKINRMCDEDKPIHDWYRFVMSFPPHLVRSYIEKFNITGKKCILDPFAGTGTTLVEAKKNGLTSIGIEANPVAHMATEAKTNWNIDTTWLIDNANIIAKSAENSINKHRGRLKCLNEEAAKLIITDSINPVPLHKSLLLLESIIFHGDDSFIGIYKTAFAKLLVNNYSNLKFGPEVGIRKRKIDDYGVVSTWLEQIRNIAFDIDCHTNFAHIDSKTYLGDSRKITDIISCNSVDAVICSPPYPNEKDYTRTTRLESVILNFINNKHELRRSKELLIRSNTRNVFKNDEDAIWVSNNNTIQDLAQRIENERIKLQKTSGFEKMYHKVVTLYFGGMTRHLEELKPILRKGAKLAYVVGDQASYFRIPIRTGQILEEIACDLGYRVIGRDLFRNRFASGTKEFLKEEVVLLGWEQ